MGALWDGVKSWWEWVHSGNTAAIEPMPLPQKFLEFKCKCGTMLVLDDRIDPGQAAVLRCDNCEETWAIVSPPLEVKSIKEVEALWPILSQ
jgi:hypothetical protein